MKTIYALYPDGQSAQEAVDGLRAAGVAERDITVISSYPMEDFEFGRKYTVVGELRGPAGSAQVLTVWIQERGQTHVRLVTVRPRWP